jgi:alpha-beta hydrolase superfamily lysophospholipase
VLLAADGLKLALHAWSVPDAAAAVFYIHGIQSHAGWLEETGDALARRRIELFALDRRGSGRSGGRRGDIESLQLLLSDYRLALATVRARAGNRPLLALGQSLGGSVLAALWVGGMTPVEALVFCAPALGQQRSRHDARALARLRRQSGLSSSPVGLADEDYTTDPRHLEAMKSDPLMLREVTDRTRAALVTLEDSYMDKSAGPAAQQPPVFLAVPTVDPIIDLSAARAVLSSLALDLSERRFATDCHYIEYSPTREQYWDWLADIASDVPAPVEAG